MKRIAAFLVLAFGFFGFFGSIASAGTISGTVTDKVTGKAVISKGYVQLWKLNSVDDLCYPYQKKAVGNGKTAYTFSVPQGVYYIEAGAENYKGPLYYNNTFIWNNASEIQITATESVTAQFALTPKASSVLFKFYEITVTPNVSKTGGQITIDAKAQTKLKGDIIAWPVITIENIGKYKAGSQFVAGTPQYVVGGIVTFVIDVPATAPNVTFSVSIVAGRSLWNPVCAVTPAGTFKKGDPAQQ